MKRRLIALMAGALLIASAAPAGANHPFVGEATATALKLVLAGETLTLGFTEGGVQSGATEGGCEGDANACAAAAAALPPFGEVVRVESPGNPGPEETTAFSMPEPLDQILDARIVSARALTTGLPNPRSLANAGEALLNVTLTQTLVGDVPQAQDSLQDISEQLSPVVDADPTGQVAPQVKGILDALVDNLESAPLATIAVGPSSSETSDANGITSAAAAAQGAVVTLVPTPENLPAAPEGLVILEVGAAKATATSDQLKGTADFDPALVRLRVFDPTANDYTVVEVPAGQQQCAGQAPLELCVRAGGGEVTQSAAGAAATASAVSVSLFNDPLPRIALDLALARAGVNAAPPPVAPQPGPAAAAPVTPSLELPRTGAAVLPALALLGMGALGVGALRRRRR